MIVEIFKLSPEGSQLTGEEPGSILELEQDKFVHSDGPIQYDLFAYVVHHELIVKGTLKAPMAMLCGRCAGFFSTFLTVSSFLHAYPIAEGMDKVDITEDIREDILVEIPSYPSCPWQGRGVCPHSGVNLDEMTIPDSFPGDSAWGALDKLDRS